MNNLGDMSASAVVRHIAGKLSVLTMEEDSLKWRFKKSLECMVEKILDLGAVVCDADDDTLRRERGGGGGELFGMWLAKLKSVAYEVEDLLDGLDANELIKKSQPKPRLFFSMNNQLVRRITIGHNLKKARKKIERLEKDGRMLMHGEFKAHTEIVNRKETSGEAMQNNIVVGRDLDKEKIIRLLLTSEANEDISIIPIVGLGGIGKTTLAASVFQDERVNVFYLRAWVSVTDVFDLRRVTSSILRCISEGINFENSDLPFLEDNMKKVLATGRYLIVLDDLWEEDVDTLESLKHMLQHGCKGSKIIITTRNQSVVQRLSTGVLAYQRKIRPVPESDQINLDVLTPSDCWELMKQRAFGPDDDPSNFEEIGMQIAEKCGGIPLVANALGKIMFGTSKNRQSWEYIRDTSIDIGSRGQMSALESLALSYYFLEQDFKMCFIYLATFPKGFVINSNLLKQQWNALGYISAGDNGQRCIDYLLQMSFLQKSRSPSTSGTDDKDEVFVTVHDLVHDLARAAMGNDLMVLDGRMEIYRHMEYCRYATLKNTGFESKAVKLSSILPAHLRALHWVDCSKTELSDDTFSFAKCLRVLELKQTFMKKLPDSICQLRRLRYLNLSDCSGLAQLPRSWSNLINLVYLNLSGCSGLAKLPESFGALITLVDINLSGCSGLVTLPESFGDLANVLYINLSGCYALAKLPESFGDLANVLRINLSGCYALAKLPESFGNVKKLVYLDLSFCSCFEGISGILGGLTSIEHLNMSNPYYYLAQCRSSLKELKDAMCTLTRLKYLNLSMFLDHIFFYESEEDNREFIKSIIALSSLEHLDLSHNTFLCDIPENVVGLKNLRTLDLSGCVRLKREQWMRFEDFPLVIRLDDGAQASSSSNIVELEDVDCEELTTSCLEKVKSTRIKVPEKQKFHKLELCWTEGSQGCVDENALLGESVPPHSLQCLDVRGYVGETCLPAWWIPSISSHLPNLIEVTMEDFPRCTVLPPLGLLPNLQKLVLRRMARITRINAGELSGGNRESFTQLSTFTLDGMENLKEFSFAAVDELVIQKCPLLSFGPLPPRAQRLVISDCSQVMSSWQKIGGIDGEEGPSAPVTELVVERCNVPLGDWILLRHLPGLHNLTITNCGNRITSSSEIIQSLSSLQSLCFSHCDGMISLPKYLGDLTSLRELTIQSCRGMKFLLQNMDKVTNLKDLYILDCPELRTWCESEENEVKLAHIRPKYEKVGVRSTA